MLLPLLMLMLVLVLVLVLMLMLMLMLMHACMLHSHSTGPGTRWFQALARNACSSSPAGAEHTSCHCGAVT
jgi:hypothetical protein